MRPASIPKIWRIAKEHDLYTVGDYLELRYGPSVRGIVATLLWLATLAILAGQLIAFAWILDVVADVPKWAGCLIAGAVMLCWATGTHAPAPLASMAAWERIGTRAVHGILFAMMVAIPVTGYIVSTSAGAGVGVFGWFEIPALLPANEGLRDVAITLHFYLAYITAALVLLHAGAALKHQFVDRDGVLRRML